MRKDKNIENYENIDIDIKPFEIIVPQELEQKIKERIIMHKPNKKGFKYALTAIMVLSVLSFSSILFVPKVNVFAKNVLTSVVRFINGDIGTENAKNNNYTQNVGVCMVEKNGYKVNIENVIMDEERLVITGDVTGSNIKISPNTNPVDLQIFLKEFSNANTSLTVQNPDNKINFKLEKDMNNGEVNKYLSLKQNSIDIALNIVKRAQKKSAYTENDEYINLEKFDLITIPINLQSIKKSLYYSCDNNIKIYKDQVNLDLQVKALTISPTRMKLTLISQNNNKDIIGFISPYIRDEDGVIYSESTGFGLFQINDVNEITLIFNPSVYFKGTNENLYFGFDGLLLNGNKSEKNKYEVQLNLNK